MARINGVQRALAIKPSSFLLKLEEELLRDLDLVLNQEEELWALKSWVNWMIQGDQNIAFYHVSTLVRRKRNQILAIKNAVGEWINEESDIKEFIRSGFNGIYLTSHEVVAREDPCISDWQARLSDGNRESINGEIQGPKTLGNYRPISLCNTVYKMVTKIIVARLRPFLDKLISPLQMAFVLGRKGIDNVIIA
ncbi:uncharacterized protein LOC142612022 [Castanea sativa]|uniref:uncharacterized protein LOC142612022 n=1 Tax=Castanea sativa TaxID=21020 RepID=UPI003F64D11C